MPQLFFRQSSATKRRRNTNNSNRSSSNNNILAAAEDCSITEPELSSSSSSSATDYHHTTTMPLHHQQQQQFYPTLPTPLAESTTSTRSLSAMENGGAGGDNDPSPSKQYRDSQRSCGCSTKLSFWQKLCKRKYQIRWIQGIAIVSLLFRSFGHFVWMHSNTSNPHRPLSFDNYGGSASTNGNGGMMARILDDDNSLLPHFWKFTTTNHHHKTKKSMHTANHRGRDPWSGQEMSEIIPLRELESRYRQRRERVRPPAAPTSAGSVTTAAAAAAAAPSQKQQVPSAGLWQDTSIRIHDDDDYDWTELCQEAGLSSKSRVVITNILGHSSSLGGPALALLLSRQCGVTHIAGVDPLYPNLRISRFQSMETYKILYRNIDSFELVVPTSSAGLSKLHEARHVEWLHQYHPTHIVHMEEGGGGGDDPSIHPAMEELMAPHSQRLRHLRHSLLSLEQILLYCRTRNKNEPISVLHVVPEKQQADSNATTTSTVIEGATQRLLEYYRSITNLPVRMHQLSLPPLFGPMINNDNSHNDDGLRLFVDHAMAAILESLKFKRTKLHRMTVLVQDNSKHNVTKTSLQAWQDVQANAYVMDRDQPYGKSAVPSKMNDVDQQVQEASSKYRKLYGIQRPQFPCSSSCNGPTSTCVASSLDAIVPVSLEATGGCQYVVYMTDFAADLSELFKPRQTSSKYLCRVAFVSGKSPVVERAIASKRKSSPDTNQSISKEDALEMYNGKLKVNGWTLVWLSNDDDSTLSDGEFSLISLDPSRFFAGSVAKAMFVGSAFYAEPPDIALVQIMQRIDRVKMPRHMVKEHRSGISVSRWVEQPAEKARSAALFVAEPTYLPKTVGEYSRLAKKYSDVSLPKRQVNFYHHTAHWVQMDKHRPELEIRNTIYAPFPLQWASMSLLVHDMRMEDARTLRCSWYDEHLYWGSNRGIEELSLAFLIAKQRIEGRMGQALDNDSSWIPMQTENGERVRNKRGAEVFLRILRRPES